MVRAVVGANTRAMKDEALRGFVEGFARNSRITEERGERLVWLLRAVVVQTLCVVLVQVAAAM